MQRTAIGAALLLTLAACGSSEETRAAAEAAARQDALSAAFIECRDEHDAPAADTARPAVEQSGDKRTLTTNSIAAYECIARALDAPASLTSRVENTTGTMGGQSFTVDGFDWIWSFNANDTPQFDLTVTIP